MRTIYAWAEPATVEHLVDTADDYRNYTYALLTLALSKWTISLQSSLEATGTLSEASSSIDEQASICCLTPYEQNALTALGGSADAMPTFLKRHAAKVVHHFLVRNFTGSKYLNTRSKYRKLDVIDFLASVHASTNRISDIKFRLDTRRNSWDPAFEFMQIVPNLHEARLCLHDKFKSEWKYKSVFSSSVLGVRNAFWEKNTQLMEVPNGIFSWTAPAAKSHSTVFIHCPRAMKFDRLRQIFADDVKFSEEFYT